MATKKFRSVSVSPRVEVLDTYTTGITDPSQSFLQSLKPFCIHDQDAKFAVGILDEGFFPELKNLGFISPPKKPVTGSGYFLRYSTKFSGTYPLSSDAGLGQGASGLCSDGLSLKENDQRFVCGALRAELALAKVT